MSQDDHSHCPLCGEGYGSSDAMDLEWKQFDKLEACQAALTELVRLKDGPRDAAYDRDKPAAWDKAREALAS